MNPERLDPISRRCLRLFPRRFRERYDDDLAELYRDLYWTPGPLARPRFALRVALDALCCGLAARWDALREPPPFPPRRQQGDIMSVFWKDLHLTARSLARRPGFTAVVLLTLALGIGANTGLFSVVNAVLLRPLAFPEPDALVRVLATDHGEVGGPISYPNFADLRDQSSSLAGAAAYDEWSANITGQGDPERLDAARVTAAFFGVLGVQAELGRTFVPAEDVDGKDRVVVLTHGLWQRRFGAEPGVVGSSVALNGYTYEIVGVLPESFEDPQLSGRRWGKPELFRPLGFDGLSEADMPSRSGNSFTAVARVAAGTSLEEAQAEIRTISARLEAEYPEDNAAMGATLVPLHDDIVGEVRRSLLILLVAVGFVLAIAAANVVNLMLSRATDRRHEIALRAALGASRGRLLRHFLTESLLLTTLGAALGLALTWGATRLLVTLGGAGIPRATDVSVDGRVLGFALLTALATALVCGLVPAFLATTNLQSPLRSGASGTLGGRSRRRLRGVLVISEVALSLLLLTCAGLLIRSFWKLTSVDPGLDPENVLTFQLRPSPATYTDAASLNAFYDELVERLEALPGVESAAATSLLPLSGGFDGNSVRPDDQPPPAPGEGASAQTRTVTPGYLEALGMTLRRGRWLQESDVAGAPQVAVITQALAELFWPSRDPIGKRLTTHGTSCEVVGVTADVKHLQLDESATPSIYIARAQAIAVWQIRRQTLVVKTSVDPMSLVPQVRREVWAIDADLPLADVKTMRQWVASTTSDPRFRTVLLASFAGLALLLAAIGIYGVLSYTVNESRSELAIRMALGAERGAVLRHVVKKGLVLVSAGLAIGLVAALGVTRLLDSLLFGVAATDPASFVVVPLTLLGVAWLASYLPARRATKIDPMSTLRT